MGNRRRHVKFVLFALLGVGGGAATWRLVNDYGLICKLTLLVREYDVSGLVSLRIPGEPPTADDDDDDDDECVNLSLDEVVRLCFKDEFEYGRARMELRGNPLTVWGADSLHSKINGLLPKLRSYSRFSGDPVGLFLPKSYEFWGEFEKGLLDLEGYVVILQSDPSPAATGKQTLKTGSDL